MTYNNKDMKQFPTPQIRIKDFLLNTKIECTDPSCLQYALILAPGHYLYLQSPYASYPKGVLLKNPVYQALVGYFSHPDNFIKAVQEGNLDNLLEKEDWTFESIIFSQLTDKIRHSIEDAYDIQKDKYSDEETYQQLICEGYFELHY